MERRGKMMNIREPSRQELSLCVSHSYHTCLTTPENDRRHISSSRKSKRCAAGTYWANSRLVAC